jgi:hypothetical protein
MAALLTHLAAAASAADLQSALLPFLPANMLEDAEDAEGEAGMEGEGRGTEGGGGGDAGRADRGWGAAQWRAATGEPPPPQQQQPPRSHSPGAAPPPPPTPLPRPSLPRALERMLRRPADEQPLDSFALRHLVLTRPRALEPLSAFAASPSRFVQRVAVLGGTGERAVLTFTLARRGPGRRARRHAATTAPASAAAASWFLVRVEGEQGAGGWGVPSAGGAPGGGDGALSSPTPAASACELAPETVVALQLEALARGDVEAAYALASPVGRAVAGDLARFRRLLASDARFRPLMWHGGWASLRRTQSIARSFVEVVAVRPAGAGTGAEGAGGGRKKDGEEAEEEEEAVYVVIASLHPHPHPLPEEGGGGEGGGSERWLIDYFAPIRDRALRRALLTGARPTAD